MELANSQSTLTGFAVQMQQLQRNVDALMNQSASSTAPIAGARQIMLLLASATTGPLATVGTVADQSMVSVTFQLGMQKSVRLEGLANGYVVSGGGGPFVESTNVYIKVTGQTSSARQAIPQIVGPVTAVGVPHTGSVRPHHQTASRARTRRTARRRWRAP